MRNPLQSTAWLTRITTSNDTVFVGTCFAFRRNDWLLTAAHCVLHATPASLRVHTLGEASRLGKRVAEIVRHPDADLALLRMSEPDVLDDRFGGETSLYDWGIPVSAFGYPEDTGEAGLEPTARYFRGNIQRLFAHVSHLGYRYEAAELSFGAPGGLSGGPVAPNSDYAMVMGLVAENLTSTTYLSTISEEATETTSRVERVHSVINYAIVVRLDPLGPWLDQYVSYPGTAM